MGLIQGEQLLAGAVSLQEHGLIVIGQFQVRSPASALNAQQRLFVIDIILQFDFISDGIAVVLVDFPPFHHNPGADQFQRAALSGRWLRFKEIIPLNHNQGSGFAQFGGKTGYFGVGIGKNIGK